MNDCPAARDEYDSYVGDIYTLLARAESPHEIAAYLRGIETDRMGMRGSSDTHRASVVAALRAVNLEPVILIEEVCP